MDVADEIRRAARQLRAWRVITMGPEVAELLEQAEYESTIFGEPTRETIDALSAAIADRRHVAASRAPRQ